MNLRQNRNQTHQQILEGKFIRNVLSDEGRAINTDIDNRMNSAGFRSGFWSDKSFNVVDGGNNLEYRHKKQHRFVDIKTRDTKSGKIRKKNHIIHNRIVYGHLNNIARELAVGFTIGVIEDLKKLED